MLELLKISLNISDNSQDTLLSAVLADAIADFEDTTGQTFDESTSMKSIVIQMAVIKYHRLGMEGDESASFSGATEKYTNGYPKEMNRRIMKYKKVRVA